MPDQSGEIAREDMATASRPALTSQQQVAVATRDVSVALSAGAGCGKTHVLVERYLSHLAPDGDDSAEGAAGLGGLIAITFTDRAAREMRDRVRRTCRERLQAARSEAEATAWLSLLRDLETARISTIHAFCCVLALPRGRGRHRPAIRHSPAGPIGHTVFRAHGRSIARRARPPQ